MTRGGATEDGPKGTRGWAKGNRRIGQEGRIPQRSSKDHKGKIDSKEP